MLQRLASLASSVLLAGCSVLGIRSGYEQPAYQVVDTLAQGVEVRRYEPRLAAETVVDATGDDGRGRAFRILAAYIFGDNRVREDVAMTAPVEVRSQSEEIAMTAPVQVEPRAEDIAMTAPVETRDEAGGLAMRFFLPSRFTLENAPVPTDARVRLVEVPAETIAALRFSGLAGDAKLERQTNALLEALAASSWRPADEPFVLYYDPPFTLPFLRRTEVAVRVAPAP